MAKKIWVYEKCKEAAKKCKSRNEFRKKYSGAYDACLNKKWLNDFFAPLSQKPSGYWDYNRCYEYAKKFISYSEFNANNYVVYRKAKEKGWIKDYFWLTNDMGFYDAECRVYKIYKYEWADLKTVYIGLTKNLKERNKKHNNGTKKKGRIIYSSVKQYALKHNLKIPKPIVLEDNLNAEEAKEKEEKWVNTYKNINYKILNKAKTGIKSSSIGGPIKIWTYEKVYEEAKKYNSRTELQKNSYGCYRAAKKNDWLDNFKWLKPKIHPNGYWDYENCFNEAKKYTFKGEFEKKSHSAFVSAKNNGWLKEYTWLKLKKIPFRTFENCLNEARKYDSLEDFRKFSNIVYQNCQKKKWLSKIKNELKWK